MKKIDNIFKERPDDVFWDKIENKLDKKKASKRIKFYRITSLAAMLVALIAAIAYFDHVLNDHNPHLFASNEDFSSFVLEDIEHEEVGLFNLQSLREVRRAYNNAFGQDKVLDIIGSYSALDGEIDLDIRLAQFTYTLSFNYDGFPDLVLEQIEGQTLYFLAEDGNSLKMNKEPYGLQLIESSFLPEYKGYKFKKLSII